MKSKLDCLDFNKLVISVSGSPADIWNVESRTVPGGTSLVVQWLTQASNAEGMDSIPHGGMKMLAAGSKE